MAVAIGLFAASCSNEKKAESTHQHEDGSAHTNDEGTGLNTSKQEEFKVDSAQTDTGHVHDESKPHTH